MSAIPLITKIRIVALIIAAFLLVGGCKAALHPKLRVAGVSQTPQVFTQDRAIYSVELVTSQSSRVFGILRMLLGLGLALYVSSPWLDLKTESSHNGENQADSLRFPKECEPVGRKLI